MHEISFTTTKDHHVVLYAEPPDLDAYLGPRKGSAAAMAKVKDVGVQAVYTRIYVLDKKLTF